VEIIVVLEDIERHGDELERTSAIYAGLSLEFELVVSPGASSVATCA
jgi:hypothetical protein